MTELDDRSTTPGWDWVIEEYEFAGLIFVRGATPQRLIEAFGAHPATALPLTAEVTYQTFGHSWIRAGRAGEWAFAINYSSHSSGDRRWSSRQAPRLPDSRWE